MSLQGLEHRLEALLEVTAVAGPGDQGAHIEGIDGGIFENFRHVAVHDGTRQALDDGGFADPRFPHEERVVLASAGKNLQCALQFVGAANERIDAPGPGQSVEIACICGQRILARLTLLFVGFWLFTFFLAVVAGMAVGKVGDHVHPRHMLFLQEVHGMGFPLGEESDQHIGAGDGILACRLHMI